VFRADPVRQGRRPGHPDAAHLLRRPDYFGLDSAYDYDPVWAKAAELGVAVTFHAGQTGVFLLHQEGVPGAAAAQYDNVYTSLDIPDVLPVDEHPRIRALVANAS